MNALTLKVPIISVVFVEPRYWPSNDEIQKAAEEVHQAVSDSVAGTKAEVQKITIHSESELDVFLAENHGKFGVFTSMSGAVQPWMLKAADHFQYMALCAGYVEDFVSHQTGNWLLERNASPATMDVYSVLKEQNKRIKLVRDKKDIKPLWQAVQAVERIKHVQLLQIGETEPWVISSDRNLDHFTNRLGFQIKRIELEELYNVYETMPEDTAREMAKGWVSGATSMREPIAEHVVQACKVTLAFKDLAKKYDSDGVAIACFAMLGALGTTSCLAVSEMNVSPEYIGTCEGDLDAGATMLLMKALSEDAPWMGNPIVGKDESINLVHCTAPRRVKDESRSYVLRSHHESGIGVSPEVTLPVDEPVTLCRIGRKSTAMSVHVGLAVENPREPTCRTQLRIELPSIDNYLRHSLGNHQIMCYGDYSESLKYVAELLKLELLTDEAA